MLLFLLVIPLLPSTYPLPVLLEGETEGSNNTGYKIASEILTKSINFSVDPCVDFFEFTCGNWITSHPIPSHKTSYSHFGILFDNIQSQMRAIFESSEVLSSKSTNALKAMYRKCMDKDELNRIGARKMIETIRGYGEWPMLEGNKWSANQFNLTTLLINIGMVRGVDIFVTNYVTLDTKNVSRRLLEFDQGALGLGYSTRDYYLKKKKHGKKIAAYRKYLISMVKLLHKDVNLPINEKKIASDVDEIIQLETELAKIIVPEENRRNYTDMYNMRRLSDMQKLMPLVDWTRYFHSIVPFEVNKYLANDPEILITEIDYMRRVTKLINSTDPRIITNYAYLWYAASWGGELGERYEDIGQESKNVTLEMINDLQEVFHTMLVENDWMDEKTKETALDKLKQMLRQIGYPDFILDDEKLDDYYDGLSIDESDSYSEMIESLSRWAIEFHFKRLLKPVDRTEFNFNPATVNAYYSSTSNAIKFPAAILQVPFFHQTFPKALNYGGIGAVIGHEITHGFDDEGRQFDAVGNLRDWWDGEVKEKFEKRTKCIIDQYSNIKNCHGAPFMNLNKIKECLEDFDKTESLQVPGTDLKLNGKQTQGENIADNGGVKQAYRAYKRYLEKYGEEERIEGLEEYNNEQMFFIGYGTIWCGHSTKESLLNGILTSHHVPANYRVNQVLANQPEFAAAFNCSVGTPMNPTERCAVW